MQFVAAVAVHKRVAMEHKPNRDWHYVCLRIRGKESGD